MPTKDEHDCLHEADFRDLAELAKDVKDIKKLLLGNGQPGIIGRLMKLEDKFSGIWYFLGPVVSAGLMAFVMKFLKF